MLRRRERLWVSREAGMLLIESLFSRPEASFVEMRERFWRRFQEREQYVRFSWRPFWICCRCAVSVSRNREQLVLYRSHAVRSLDVPWSLLARRHLARNKYRRQLSTARLPSSHCPTQPTCPLFARPTCSSLLSTPPDQTPISGTARPLSPIQPILSPTLARAPGPRHVTVRL